MNTTRNLLCMLGLAASVAAFAPDASAGTLGPYPTWTDELLDLDNLGYGTHPALTGVATIYREGVSRVYKSVDVYNHVVNYHAGHGDLGIIRPDMDGNALPDWGSLDTALDYIFDIAILGDSLQPSGIAILGVDDIGRSRVLYAPWTNSASKIEDLVFTDMVPASAVGERFLYGTIVESFLYVFEGTTAQVRRFYDNNSDGLPDTADSITPANVDTVEQPEDVVGLHTPTPVFGFYVTAFGELCLRYGADSAFFRWVVEDFGTNIQVTLKRATQKPYADVYGPSVSGMGRVSIYTVGLSMVRLMGGANSTEPLTRQTNVSGESEYFVVDLLRPMATTDILVMEGTETSGGSSYSRALEVSVEPARPVFMAGDPHVWHSGKRLIVLTENTTPTAFVSLEIDGVATSALYTLVPPEVIVMEPITLPSGSLGQDVVIKLSDFAHPGQTAYKKVALLPGS